MSQCTCPDDVLFSPQCERHRVYVLSTTHTLPPPMSHETNPLQYDLDLPSGNACNFESIVMEFLKVAHVQSEQERVERLSKVFHFVRRESFPPAGDRDD